MQKGEKIVINSKNFIKESIHMKPIRSSGEHGAVYHFNAYPQWTTICAPIPWCTHMWYMFSSL